MAYLIPTAIESGPVRVFNTRVAKSCFTHPAAAIGSGKIKAAP